MDKIPANAGETASVATVATVAPYIYNDPLRSTVSNTNRQHQQHQQQHQLQNTQSQRLQQKQQLQQDHEHQQYYQGCTYVNSDNTNVVSSLHDNAPVIQHHQQQHYNAFNAYAAENYHNIPQPISSNYGKISNDALCDTLKARHVPQELQQQVAHGNITTESRGSISNTFKSSESEQHAVKPKATATAFYAQPVHTTTIAPAIHTTVPTTSYYDAYKYSKLSPELATTTSDYAAYGTPYTNINYQQQQQQYYAAAKTQLQHDANYVTKQMLQQASSFPHVAFNTSNFSGNTNINSNSPNTFYDKYSAVNAQLTSSVGMVAAPRGPYTQTPSTHLTYPHTTRYSPGIAATVAPGPLPVPDPEMYRKPTSNWHWNMDYNSAKSHCHSVIPTAAIAPSNANTTTFHATQQTTQMPHTPHNAIYGKYDKYTNAYYQHQQYMPAQRPGWSASATPHTHLTMLSERHLPPHPHNSTLPHPHSHPAPFSHPLSPSSVNIRQNCCPQSPYPSANQQPCYYPRGPHPTYSPPYAQQAHYVGTNGNSLPDYTQYSNKMKYTSDLCVAAPVPSTPYFHGTATAASQQRLSPTTQNQPTSLQPQSHYYSNDLNLQTPLDNYVHSTANTNLLRQHVDINHTPLMPYATQQPTEGVLNYQKPQHDVGQYLPTEDKTTHKYLDHYDNYNALACGTQEVTNNSNNDDNTSEEHELQTPEKSPTTTKNLSIRDFLASWNDDEDDYVHTDALSFPIASTDNEVNLQIPAIDTAQDTTATNFAIPDADSQVVENTLPGKLVEANQLKHDKPNKNLPDIIIDIAKPHNLIQNLDSFDVEKELDELQIKRRKMSDDKPIITDSNEQNEIYTMLSEKSMENTFSDLLLKTISANENTTAEIKNNPAQLDHEEQFLKDIQLNDSSSNQSNESTFEKEYETFINKICSEQDAVKPDVDKSETQDKSETEAKQVHGISNAGGKVNELVDASASAENIKELAEIGVNKTGVVPHKANDSEVANQNCDFVGVKSQTAATSEEIHSIDAMAENEENVPYRVRPLQALENNDHHSATAHCQFEESTADVEKFSKFHKRKRKLIESTKEIPIVLLKCKTKAELKQTSDLPNYTHIKTNDFQKKRNAIAVKTKPLKRLNFSAKSNVSALGHYYKTLWNVRRNVWCKPKRVLQKQTLACRRDPHLSLMNKRASMKNLIKSRGFNPKSLQCLSIAIINSEAFRCKLLCVAETNKIKKHFPRTSFNKRYAAVQSPTAPGVPKCVEKCGVQIESKYCNAVENLAKYENETEKNKAEICVSSLEQISPLEKHGNDIKNTSNVESDTESDCSQHNGQIVLNGTEQHNNSDHSSIQFVKSPDAANQEFSDQAFQVDKTEFNDSANEYSRTDDAAYFKKNIPKLEINKIAESINNSEVEESIETPLKQDTLNAVKDDSELSYAHKEITQSLEELHFISNNDTEENGLKIADQPVTENREQPENATSKIKRAKWRRKPGIVKSSLSVAKESSDKKVALKIIKKSKNILKAILRNRANKIKNVLNGCTISKGKRGKFPTKDADLRHSVLSEAPGANVCILTAIDDQISYQAAGNEIEQKTADRIDFETVDIEERKTVEHEGANENIHHVQDQVERQPEHLLEVQQTVSSELDDEEQKTISVEIECNKVPLDSSKIGESPEAPEDESEYEKIEEELHVETTVKSESLAETGKNDVKQHYELSADITTTSLEDDSTLYGFSETTKFKELTKADIECNTFEFHLTNVKSRRSSSILANSPKSANVATATSDSNDDNSCLSEESCSGVTNKSDASDFNELAALEKELSQHHLKSSAEVSVDECDEHIMCEKTENNFTKELKSLLKNEPANIIDQMDARSLVKKMLESDSEDEKNEDEVEEVSRIEHTKKAEYMDETVNSIKAELQLHQHDPKGVDTAINVIPKLSDLCKIALNSSLNDNLLNVNIKIDKNVVEQENVVDIVDILESTENIDAPNNSSLVGKEDSSETNETFIITLQENENVAQNEMSVEEALAEMYRQAGVILSDNEETDNNNADDNDNDNKLAQDVLLINLEEILAGNSDLYVLQCDMNENVLSVVTQQLQETGNDEQLTEDNENNIERVNTLELIEILNASDDDDDDREDADNEPVGHSSKHLVNNESGTQTPTVYTKHNDDSLSHTFLDYNSSSQFDLPTIHHEEIVPDNYKAFEREQFFKYLQKKYVQRHLHKFYHANQILKKYKKTFLKSHKTQLHKIH